MPSVNKSNIINEIRERKRLRQAKLLQCGEFNATTLSRITNRRQNPYTQTSIKIIHEMDIPAGTLFNPFLENQPLSVYEMRNRLLYTLDHAHHSRKYLDKSTKLLNRMKLYKGFESGINRQFILSCQARISIIRKEDPQKILIYTQEGIIITYPEYNPDTFEGDVLLYEEARLIHTQALAYKNSGETRKAMALLQRTMEGLSRLSHDDRDKTHHLAPIMFDLSSLLIDAGEYGSALDLCDSGIDDITTTRTKGRYAPDFTYNKARALYYLGQKEGLPDLLSSAFHGFIIMRILTKAQEVRTFALNIGIIFDTYGVEKLPMFIPDAEFDRGKPIMCTHFGELMGGLRSEAGMTLAEVCEGLCNTSTFSRMEMNKSEYPIGSVYLLEAFMQRMGRDIDKYFYTLLNDDDFEDKQLRDKIYTLQAARSYDEMEPLLKDLKTKKKYKEGINLQFIKMSEAELHGEKNGYDSQYMKMLLESWRVTKGTLDEGKIAHMRLTFYEIVILNDMAVYFCDNGESDRGLKIFEGIIKNMETHYVDESERMRTYLTVLRQYAKFLSRNDKREKALALAKNGLELSIKHNDLWHASSFVIDVAVNLFQLGQKKKSIPYFAQAFYGSVVMKRPVGIKNIREYAREHLGITFL
ncbi:MAG: hypothetical protein FWE90_13175 [Defluviitaleaceae bacterium]|nr:hypothetical protein [Defluviitaleaceae bacterium]